MERVKIGNYAGISIENAYSLGMINFGPKAKVSKKPAKKTPKASARVSHKPASKPDDGFTPEDIAEMNMFGAAFAKANWEAEKKNWAKIVAKANAESKAKRKA
jgi:hypothetical protein